MSLITKETIVTRLYPSRNVSFVKTYIFENDEKSQKDEPLTVEYDIPNTLENNLGIPLPKGEIQLYQLLRNGSVEFVGKDKIKQIPRNETANISSGKAFDVVGARNILNYDRQQKSEEASISIKVANSQENTVEVKLVEHIYGDWVIRNASTDYRKVDASTIHFMIRRQHTTSVHKVKRTDAINRYNSKGKRYSSNWNSGSEIFKHTVGNFPCRDQR